jgi:chemotaxis protein histidine kinase CheA
MHEINKVLSAAAWRLGVVNFFKGLVYAATLVVVGLLLARIVQQVFGLTFAWKIIGYSAAGAALLAGLVWCIAVRPSKAAVARRVDEGANLKESLSTALSIEKYQNDDPWARVTVESAVRQARGVRMAQAVPIAAPRFWPVPFALALAFAVVWMAFPRLDVLGWRAKAVAEEKRTVAITQVKAEAIDVKKKLDEVSDKLGLEKDKVEPPTADKPEPRDPEAMKRAVLKDLAKMSERLDQLRNGEKGQKLDALQDKLKNLKTPGDKSSELTKAMAKSDFSGAQKEIEKMKESMASGSLSEKQKQEMSDQLENLSKQLAEMAKNKEQLENAMKQAGLDPKAAGDKESMQKALEAAKNLTAEQKKALSEMAQAQSQSQNSMDQLSKAASQMSQASKSGDQQGMQQAAGQMQQQMNQLEQLQQEMQLADSAKSDCQNKMQSMCKGGDKEGEGECNKPGDCNGNSQTKGNGSTKPWSASWSTCQGNGRGGGGLAQGGTSSTETADFNKYTSKNVGLKGDGPIVSSRMVEGDSIRGESKADFVSVATKAEQGATEAMENNTIPREFHDAVKNYFGNLKGGGKSAKDAPPAAPAKPAVSAKDAGK